MSQGQIRFRCGCGHELRAPLAFAGRKAKCPHCQALMVVPTPPGPPAAPAPTAKPAPPPAPAAKPEVPRPGPPVKEGPGGVQIRPDLVERRARKKTGKTAELHMAELVARPAGGQALIVAAQEAFDQGLDRRARSILEGILAVDAGHVRALVLLAQLHERAAEVEPAIECYLRAARAGDAGARQAAAELVLAGPLDEARRALAAGAAQQALALAERWLAALPDVAELGRLKAEALRALGRPDLGPTGAAAP